MLRILEPKIFDAIVHKIIIISYYIMSVLKLYWEPILIMAQSAVNVL